MTKGIQNDSGIVVEELARTKRSLVFLSVALFVLSIGLQYTVLASPPAVSARRRVAPSSLMATPYRTALATTGRTSSPVPFTRSPRRASPPTQPASAHQRVQGHPRLPVQRLGHHERPGQGQHPGRVRSLVRGQWDEGRHVRRGPLRQQRRCEHGVLVLPGQRPHQRERHLQRKPDGRRRLRPQHLHLRRCAVDGPVLQVERQRADPPARRRLLCRRHSGRLRDREQR